LTKVTSISSLALIGLTVPPSGVGTPLAGTPKNSLAAGLSYEHIHMAGGEVRLAVNAHYQSSFLPALSETIPTVGGYTMIDARATFTRKQWMATLYVDNLTNELGITGYTDPASYGKLYQALVSTPRTVGLKLGYSFRGW
jgi:outer membrane receptor protein involved in Fe transport